MSRLKPGQWNTISRPEPFTLTAERREERKPEPERMTQGVLLEYCQTLGCHGVMVPTDRAPYRMVCNTCGQYIL